MMPGFKALRQVDDRLRELDDTVAEWDPTEQAFPAWRSKVTPEGATRKRQWTFKDDSGVERLFDLHARFTPGAGRIHFCLVPETERRMLIAYIGLKP
jgi:hypothetical protein